MKALYVLLVRFRINALWGPHCLCEGQTSLLVDLEDLLNGGNVGCSAKIQSQVIGHSGVHDIL